VQVLTRILAAVVWLLVAVLVALGGAGVVAAMNHVPGTAARAELTWAADEAAKAKLNEATDRLEALSNEVERLGSAAREALAAVSTGDPSRVTDAISAGTDQLAAVAVARAALEAAIADVPAVGPGNEMRISAEVQDRYDGLAITPELTSDLDDDWTLFTGRALDAVNLNALLSRHDEETAAAAQQGGQEKYRRALALLDVSDATITQMEAVRDRLAKTVDVGVLNEWIDRNAGYDAALRNLYEVLIEADGAVTNEVREAFEGEQAARRRLPGDTRPIVVIMADVAQGGLNQAVISIEETAASLSDALVIQRQLQEDVEIALPDS